MVGADGFEPPTLCSQTLETLCFRRFFCNFLRVIEDSLGTRFPRFAGISIIFQTKTRPNFLWSLASILPWRWAAR